MVHWRDEEIIPDPSLEKKRRALPLEKKVVKKVKQEFKKKGRKAKNKKGAYKRKENNSRSHYLLFTT